MNTMQVNSSFIPLETNESISEHDDSRLEKSIFYEKLADKENESYKSDVDNIDFVSANNTKDDLK